MKKFFIFVIVGFLAGCSNYKPPIPDEAFESKPTLASSTQTLKLLKSLPEAAQQIPLSVYRFTDQTGQLKPGEISTSSSAVTQGGLAILKKALLDAGSHSWFRVLERGGLNNLIQERNLIRLLRAQQQGNSTQTQLIEPMLYAGLILEGGIISYESNVINGGLGARYLGIGGDTKYSRDMVTVYLRAVSVSTGEVLLSVSASKTIYSRSVQGGIFYFVSYDKLTEGEAGMSYNEPPQLAVRQAIELAVYSLVMEGYRNGLWKFMNQDEGDNRLQRYEEKYYTTAGYKRAKKPVVNNEYNSKRHT